MQERIINIILRLNLHRNFLCESDIQKFLIKISQKFFQLTRVRRTACENYRYKIKKSCNFHFIIITSNCFAFEFHNPKKIKYNF